MVFNISFDLSASTDPSNPNPGSFIHKRFDLGKVIVKNPKEQLDIWNDEIVLKIPAKNTQSFKIRYHIETEGLKGNKLYAYHIVGTYINPKTGGLSFLTSDIKIHATTH